MKDKNIQLIQVDDATVRIGDIFHTSWGYEQTNVEFYQVVSLHGTKTVGLCEIASQIVKDTGGYSARVRPVPDKFISDEVYKRRVRVRGSGSYSVSVRFESYRSAYLTSPDETHHCSWGY